MLTCAIPYDVMNDGAAGRRLLQSGEFAIEIGDIVNPVRKHIILTGGDVVLEENAWAKDILD